MSVRWLPSKKDIFVRDLVRDYCTVNGALMAQRARFARDGSVSYAVLRDLMGEAMQKGVFWRLKDTSHHLFRGGQGHESPEQARHAGGIARHPPASPDPRPVEGLLDWCVGYAFHECAKLREDAFQGRHYANRLTQLGRLMEQCRETETGLILPLEPLVQQTATSSLRELDRILLVLAHGRVLLARYLAGQGHNTHLARWLVREEALARRVFGQRYGELMAALYGEEPERLYVLAAQNLRDAGRYTAAREVLGAARARGLLGRAGKELLAQLDEVEMRDAGGILCAECRRNGAACDCGGTGHLLTRVMADTVPPGWRGARQ